MWFPGIEFMKEISINGYKLHQVQMLMTPYYDGCVSYLSYPKNRINFEESERGIALRIPPFLAIELFRQGIFPQDAKECFPVKISGKLKGSFRISDFRYPSSIEETSVIITLERHQPGSLFSGVVEEK